MNQTKYHPATREYSSLRRVKIHISDINHDSVHNLLSWIREIVDVEITSNNPDYLIHSCFGYDLLEYKCVRICWVGENIIPDFNLSDYAMGFARMDFGDRYRRIPLYRFYFSDYESLFDSKRDIPDKSSVNYLENKELFCTMVISNTNRGLYFSEFLDSISDYKTISSGGRALNNIGEPVNDKIEFLRRGKFHLAFENSSYPGYITEKILHAFVAGTVPIYWGAPDIGKDFNPKSFINCHDYDSIENVIKEVKRLDEDAESYGKIISEPCFLEGKEPITLRKTEIISWLRDIFCQEPANAIRRNTEYWGDVYEARLRRAFLQPYKQLLRFILGKQ